MILQKEILSTREIVECHNKFCITFHTSPDLDALCSALALKRVLTKLGKKTIIVSPSDISDFLKTFLSEEERIIIAKDDPQGAKEAFFNSKVSFFLDLSQVNRLGSEIESFFHEIDSTKIVIDHHKAPNKTMGNVWLHSEKSSSTCEVLYEVFSELGWLNSNDKEIAELLYVGISSDTGNFSYSNTTQNTFKTAASLVCHGVNVFEITQKLRDNKSINWIKFLGFALSSKLEILCNDKVAFLEIKAEEREKFGVDYEEIGDLLSYVCSIKSVEVVILAKEKDDLYRLSFRSKEKIDVAEFASKFFEGGGHFSAAGGVYKGDKRFLKKEILYKINKIGIS